MKIEQNLWKQTFYDRDSYGRILKKTDSLGHVTRYSYQNGSGHLLKEPSQVTDSCGQTCCYEYDKAGRLTTIRTEKGTREIRYNKQNYPSYIQDENGNETRKLYDKMGNLAALFPPNQGAEGKSFLYRYDFFDRLIEERDQDNVFKTFP